MSRRLPVEHTRTTATQRCDSYAAAQSKTALSWVREPGAESCIGAPELGARVERLVGPVLVPAPSGEVSVEGRIARRRDRYVAAIAISDAAGAIAAPIVVRRTGNSSNSRANAAYPHPRH